MAIAVLIDAVTRGVRCPGVQAVIVIVAVASPEELRATVAVEVEDRAPHAHEVTPLIAAGREQPAFGHPGEAVVDRADAGS